MTPFLLVLSSPSGGGKTTIAKALLAARDDLGYSVSATTRTPREGEHEGVDYDFLTLGEFNRRRDRGEFIEWADYGGHLYGTLAWKVDRLVAEGLHVVLDIEVEGARQVRERRDDVVSIFILPPSADVLVARLTGRERGQGGKVLRDRMCRALEELEEAHDYDYIVVNDDRAQAVSEVAAIIDAESRRTHRISTLTQSLHEFHERLTTLVDRMAT